MRRQIAVDFDKTLHKYGQGWHDGSVYDEPVPGAALAMHLLHEAGFEIVIFSCRNYTRPEKHTRQIEPDQIEEMRTWLKKHNIHFDKFWTACSKPPADLFIDDKGLRFEGNWSETYRQAMSILEKKP